MIQKVTAAEINKVLGDRAIAQSIALENIANQTSQSLEQIKKTFSIAISSSSSFGYVAGSNLINYCKAKA